MNRILAYLPSNLEARFSRAVMRLLAGALGPRAAIGWMTHSPLRRRTRARLLWLHKRLVAQHGQEMGDRFVESYLCAKPRPKDYRILLCETDDQTLSARLKGMLPRLAESARGDPARSAGLAVALLERGEADLLDVLLALIESGSSHPTVPTAIRAIFLRPLGRSVDASLGLRGVHTTSRPAPCRRRLLVIDGDLHPKVISRLAAGAEKLTIIRYGDLYGHLDLPAIQAELPEIEITIEHARTRVDRFHRRYYQLHEASSEAAAALSTSFFKANPWIDLEIPSVDDIKAEFILGVADLIFFKMLRMDGVAQALRDPSFDNVIISFSENRELYGLCAAMPDLIGDARVQACSWLPGPAQIQFEARQAAMGIQEEGAYGYLPGILAEIRSFNESPLSVAPEAVRAYLRKTTRLPPRRPGSHHRGRPSLALVSNETRAYAYNAIQIACALQDHFDVDVVWTQGREKSFNESLSRASDDVFLRGLKQNASTRPAFMRAASPAPDKRANAAIRASTFTAFAGPLADLANKWQSDPAVSNALACLVRTGLAEFMLKQLGQVALARRLLETYDYDAIAISPIRTSNNAIVGAVARMTGTPTLTIETHCLNASYCRYTNVRTDYAAVYSDHFVREYDRYFGIPADRVRSFGSPRILRPQDYESEEARRLARERIGTELSSVRIIAFPTQPMPPALSLALWRMIILAAKALKQPTKVLLKIHPEEGQGHVERYRQIVEDEAAGDICSVVDVDIKDLLMASDLVLTAYSVTALEAVVLDRNVAIVAQPGVNYPVAYNEILGLPLCSTREETIAAMEDAFALGLEARSGAGSFKCKNPHLFDNSTYQRLKEIVDEIMQKGTSGIRERSELPQEIFVTAPFQEYML
ncbi:hypothetical protein GOA58_00350 [Sinorhizobium meliloti]|nr:hypothetical protein [Sinorhizobium meliloti]MDW9659736.1 hypothetical protein [Sinorhizobium meliloti]MDX0048847.1 hypothetical protein [Sinorhizobium meliloti]